MPAARRALPPGALLDLLQKGLHYKELQAQPAAAGDAGSGESGATHEWRVFTAQQLLHAADATALACSATSGTAAAAAPAANGAVELAGHTADVLVAARCGASGLLATGSADGTARIWRPLPATAGAADSTEHASGAAQRMDTDGANAGQHGAAPLRRPEATLLHHVPDQGGPLAVHAAAWAPDGKWLATATHDGIARIWSAEGALLLSRMLRTRQHARPSPRCPAQLILCIRGAWLTGSARRWCRTAPHRRKPVMRLRPLHPSSAP